MSPLGQITRRSTFPLRTITHLSPIPDICHAHHQTTRSYLFSIVEALGIFSCRPHCFSTVPICPSRARPLGKLNRGSIVKRCSCHRSLPRDQRPMASPLRIVGFLFRLHPLPPSPFLSPFERKRPTGPDKGWTRSRRQ